MKKKQLMKYLIWIGIITYLLTACHSVGESVKTPKLSYESIGTQNTGGIKGKVVDVESDEELPFATVRLYLNDVIVGGANTDFDGKFEILNLDPGLYNLEVSYMGYPPLRLENLEVQAGKMLFIDDAELIMESQVIELKSMIYLYPESGMEVDVTLHYDGELTHTYPKSEGNWSVQASPDGTLVDANGRQYYGLFWEGIPNDPIQPTSGTVVSKDSLIPFLETSLDQLGLNFKEANEFIVFWLPILEQHPYNLIYFAGTDYTDHAELNISPTPETVIRVMMGYVPLDNAIDFNPQILPERPNRAGFTVVEWGGAKCRLPNF